MNRRIEPDSWNYCTTLLNFKIVKYKKKIFFEKFICES